MTNPVIDNPARSRYELALEAGVAFVDYQQAGNVRVLTHSEVPPALRGRGIGAALNPVGLIGCEYRGRQIMKQFSGAKLFTLEQQRASAQQIAPATPP
jgi:uncharacterized protein